MEVDHSTCPVFRSVPHLNGCIFSGTGITSGQHTHHRVIRHGCIRSTSDSGTNAHGLEYGHCVLSQRAADAGSCDVVVVPRDGRGFQKVGERVCLDYSEHFIESRSVLWLVTPAPTH